jgi:hypothetical protein
MSGGAGHIFSMIASLKHNKRNRKNLFDKDVDEHNENYGKIIDYKKMSPEQFEAFKRKLRQKEVERQKRLTIVFGSVMVVIVAALVYLLFFY